MTTKQAPTSSKFYTDLFAHCQKQYKDIAKIRKAYVSNKQVFGIDYINTNGKDSITCNTCEADAVIYFINR